MHKMPCPKRCSVGSDAMSNAALVPEKPAVAARIPGIVDVHYPLWNRIVGGKEDLNVALILPCRDHHRRAAAVARRLPTVQTEINRDVNDFSDRWGPSHHE